MTEPTEPARKPLGMLERRRIEAEIIKPIYAELKSEVGTERAQGLLRRAIHTASKRGAQEFARSEPYGTDHVRFHKLQHLWTQDDALHIEVLTATPERLDYNVRRCRYAEMYQGMGLGEIGHLLSCNRDATFCEGYDPRVKVDAHPDHHGGRIALRLSLPVRARCTQSWQAAGAAR